MPTVPTYIAQREPPRIPDVPTPRGVPGMFGEGLAQGVQQATSDFAKIAQANQQRRDNADEAEALTTASLKISEYLHGAPDAAGNMQPGALGTLGKESTGMSKKFGELSRKWEEEIGDGLSPNVREKFKQRYSMEVANAIGRLSSHEASQLREYDKDRLNSASTLMLNTAAINYADDNANRGLTERAVKFAIDAAVASGAPPPNPDGSLPPQLALIKSTIETEALQMRSGAFADNGNYAKARELAKSGAITPEIMAKMLDHVDRRESQHAKAIRDAAEAQRTAQERAEKEALEAANRSAGELKLATMKDRGDKDFVDPVTAKRRLNSDEFKLADPGKVAALIDDIENHQKAIVAPADTFPSVSDAGIHTRIEQLLLESPSDAADLLHAATRIRRLSQADIVKFGSLITTKMDERENAAMRVIFRDWYNVQGKYIKSPPTDSKGNSKAQYFYQGNEQKIKDTRWWRSSLKPSENRDDILLGEMPSRGGEDLTPKQLDDLHKHFKSYLKAYPDASVDKIEKYARELLYPIQRDAIQRNLPQRMAEGAMKINAALSVADESRRRVVASLTEQLMQLTPSSTLEELSRRQEIPDGEQVVTKKPTGTTVPIIVQQAKP